MGGKAFKKERKGRNFGNPKKYVISAKRSPPDMHVMCNNTVTHKRYTKQNFILQYMKIFIKTVDTLRRSQCKRTKCFFRNTMDINSGCGISQRYFVLRKLEWLGYHMQKNVWWHVIKAILIQYCSVTDGQMDRIAISILCAVLMSDNRNINTLIDGCLVLSDGVFHKVTLLFFADTGVRTSSIRS